MMAAAVTILAFGARAQVQTDKTVEHGAPSKDVTVERGEVVRVSGNDLLVKMEDGTLRDFPNVPDSTTVNVEGRQLTVHDLKPGMKLQRTITTTTTPRTVTTVQTVKGKVFNVMAPNSVILTLEDGTNQRFTIPKDQKFTIDGKTVDAFGLRKGMNISATKVVEVPETVVSQQRTVTGTLPPPPPDQPILVVIARPAPAPAPAARPVARPEPVQTALATPPPAAPAALPKQLPKTGSNLPLIGLLGILSLALAAGLRLSRA
jgi:LPXTG-motif cell wall-anchored protein